MFCFIFAYLLILQVVNDDGDDRYLLTKKHSFWNHRSGSDFQPHTLTSYIALARLLNFTMSKFPYLLKVDNKIYFI